MLFGFVAFLALGVFFLGMSSSFSAVIMLAISLVCLSSYIIGKKRPRDIFAIQCRIINVSIVVMLLAWGMLAADDNYMWVFTVVMFIYLWLSGYWLRVWVAIVLENSWRVKYREVYMSLPSADRVMLITLEASTEKRSFRSFVKKFGKRNVQKLMELSKYDDTFLIKLRELIESRKYKQIKAMMATK